MTITSAEPTSPLVIDDAQLIGGRWVGACGGQTIDVIDPATGEVLAVHRAATRRVDMDVAVAQQALPAWRDTDATACGALLSRWVELVDANDDAIGRLEAWRSATRLGLTPMASLLFVAGQADKVSGMTLPSCDWTCSG